MFEKIQLRGCEGYLDLLLVMKIYYAIGLIVAAVIVTVIVEESRISALRQDLKTAIATETTTTSKTVIVAASDSYEAQATPLRTKSRPDKAPTTTLKEAASLKEADTEEESFAKTARKMWDNPAGKSMMNQGVKMAVGMIYQDFIDDLNLTKDEGDYLKNLLGKEMSDQQEIGMKLLGATKEERDALVEEMGKRAKENEAEIEKFLNSEEDVKAFTNYKNHLPERQQLDGIRAAMTGKGVPLDADLETKLVDAMYRARTEANTPDLSGPNGITEMAKGNIVETYEKSWEIQQQTLRAETSKILNKTQLAAFEEYQKQVKEMQLMGLKMAEKMMPDLKEVINAPEKKVDFK